MSENSEMNQEVKEETQLVPESPSPPSPKSEKRVVRGAPDFEDNPEPSVPISKQMARLRAENEALKRKQEELARIAQEKDAQLSKVAKVVNPPNPKKPKSFWDDDDEDDEDRDSRESVENEGDDDDE